MKRAWTLLSATAILAGTAAAFSGCNGNFEYDEYANANLYSVGSASLSSAQVRKLEIDWVGGSVEVEQASSEKLLVSEDANGLSQEARMRYYLDGDVLKVKYCQSGLRASVNEQNKNLRVSLPVGVALDIECVEATVTVGAIDVTEFSVESVSGNITAEHIRCKEADVETVSGKATLGELHALSLSAETVSGDFSVDSLSVERLEAETTSGKLTLGVISPLLANVDSNSGDVIFTLPAGALALARFETASGEFHSEKTAKQEGNTYYLNGTTIETAEYRLEVETFSGNVYIL